MTQEFKIITYLTEWLSEWEGNLRRWTNARLQSKSRHLLIAEVGGFFPSLRSADSSPCPTHPEIVWCCGRFDFCWWYSY